MPLMPISSADPDPTVDVAVIYALEIEAGPLADRLTQRTTVRGKRLVVRRGLLAPRSDGGSGPGKSVAIAHGGPGTENARAATDAVLDAHRPRWLIAAGLAGGLVPAVKRHDIILAETIVGAAAATAESPEGSSTLHTGLGVPPTELRRYAGVHLGRLLTWPHTVVAPEEKRQLGERFDALAVDMESYAVAEACRRRGQPMLCVRVVGDPVDERLPGDVEHLLRQRSMAARWGAAARAVVRRPAAVKDFWRLRENATMAAERLADFLVDMIARLP